MKDRIDTILKTEGLSSKEFADKIGVQSSNVSHVLNGRSNPSFPFIEKIVKAFPHINARWIISGEGKMYENTPDQSKNHSNLFSAPQNDDHVINKPLSQPEEDLFNELNNEVKTQTTTPEKYLIEEEIVEQNISRVERSSNEEMKMPVIKEEVHRKITRILAFFDDGTFTEYTSN